MKDNRMKKRKSPFCQIILLFSLFCLVKFNAIADDNVNVKKISAETGDSILFQISIDKPSITRGEDIIINYNVTNKGSKDVYLLTIPPPLDVRTVDVGILEILSPIIYPDAHFRYTYNLIKIRPKKSYKGTLNISAKVYLTDKVYGFEDAEIKTNFSYLFEISGLRDCEKANYSLPCLSEVYKKAKTLTLGNLFLQIKSKDKR